MPPSGGVNAVYYPPGAGHGKYDMYDHRAFREKKPLNDVNAFFPNEKASALWCTEDPPAESHAGCEVRAYHKYFVFRLQRCVPLIYGECMDKELEEKRRLRTRNIFLMLNDCVTTCGVYPKSVLSQWPVQGEAGTGEEGNGEGSRARGGPSAYHIEGGGRNERGDSRDSSLWVQVMSKCLQLPKVMGECHNYSR